MIYHLPDYYEKFNCIAGKCPDSCCRGWRTIAVDEKSYEKYNDSSHEFASHIRQQIKTIDNRHFFKLEEGRCPFLNEENLCDIIIEMGENMLCTTCATYPRFVYQGSDGVYACLTMSCPVVADMILTREEPFEILVFDDEKNEIYDTMELPALQIMFDKSIPFKIRLATIAILSSDNADYAEYEAAMETITDHQNFIGLDDIRIEFALEYLIIFERMLKKSERNTKIVKVMSKYLKMDSDGITDPVESLLTLYRIYEKYVQSEAYEENEKEFTNYIAYRLYRSHYLINDKDDFNEEMFMTVVSMVAIKLIQAMIWNEDGSISSEDRHMVFQCHSKALEHSEKMYGKMKDKFRDSGYIKIINILVSILA